MEEKGGVAKKKKQQNLSRTLAQKQASLLGFLQQRVYHKGKRPSPSFMRTHGMAALAVQESQGLSCSRSRCPADTEGLSTGTKESSGSNPLIGSRYPLRSNTIQGSFVRGYVLYER